MKAHRTSNLIRTSLSLAALSALLASPMAHAGLLGGGSGLIGGGGLTGGFNSALSPRQLDVGGRASGNREEGLVKRTVDKAQAPTAELPQRTAPGEATQASGRADGGLSGALDSSTRGATAQGQGGLGGLLTRDTASPTGPGTPATTPATTAPATTTPGSSTGSSTPAPAPTAGGSTSSAPAGALLSGSGSASKSAGGVSAQGQGTAAARASRQDRSLSADGSAGASVQR